MIAPRDLGLVSFGCRKGEAFAEDNNQMKPLKANASPLLSNVIRIQLPFERVFLDVAPNAVQLLFVSDDSIVVATLPEGMAGCALELINLFSRYCFKCTNQLP